MNMKKCVVCGKEFKPKKALKNVAALNVQINITQIIKKRKEIIARNYIFVQDAECRLMKKLSIF